MKRPKRVPVWLRRLPLVKAELGGLRFPRTAEEGLRQAAALSATSLRVLESQEGASKARRLLARMACTEARRILFWKKERARYFRQ